MRGRTRFVTYLSPAKLNLGLRVVGKRPDGYHLLKTIFCLCDLFDQISIQIIDTPHISLIEHFQAWSYTTDLGYRAAKLLHQVSDCKFGANIKIKKTIPSGAGLGGGSSNAATVLVALNHLWQINLPLEQLIDLGRQLGADVPFFIYGKNAYAEGIGDQFSEIELPIEYFVLIQPDFHIPTKNIFTAIDINQMNTADQITPELLLAQPINDLQAVAIKLYPQLSTIITQLSIFGTPTMTGSGSVLFLRFPDFNSANKVAQSIGKRYNTYLVKSLKLSPIYAMSF